MINIDVDCRELVLFEDELIIFVFAFLPVSILSNISHRKINGLHYNKDTTNRYCSGGFILIRRINYHCLTGITWCSLRDTICQHQTPEKHNNQNYCRH